MPADITGTRILADSSGGGKSFEFQKGPLFANIVLADEINRATPKTQSALLEAMNELQVTVDGHSYPLAAPFMVMATQNPVEHHGTYPLPESQLDRFLMRLRMGYPDGVSEREILRSATSGVKAGVKPVLAAEEVLELQRWVAQVRVDEAIVDYMMAIVAQTRKQEALSLGVSPRGAQALYRATQALALVEGRDYAIPDDVKRLAVPIFAHRVVINTRVALAQRASDLGDRILEEILTRIEVPL